MKVLVDKSFEKDTNKISDNTIALRVAKLIEAVMAANIIEDISSVKKLKGFRFHYRIRLGDYRAGVVIKNDTVVFERFLHRKDIYKFFPS